MSRAEEPLRSVLQKCSLVESAWLFGSSLTGRTRPDSDIDLGILVTRPLHWTEYADLQQDLAQAAATDSIDLTVLNDTGPILRFEAVRGRNLVCKNAERQAAFVSLAAREYEESMARMERFREMKA